MGPVDHVVLGAGAVGMAIAEALVRRGKSVRVVNRSGLREAVADVESVRGDVTGPPETRTTRKVVALVSQAAGTEAWLNVIPA